MGGGGGGADPGQELADPSSRCGAARPLPDLSSGAERGGGGGHGRRVP